MPEPTALQRSKRRDPTSDRARLEIDCAGLDQRWRKADGGAVQTLIVLYRQQHMGGPSAVGDDRGAFAGRLLGSACVLVELAAGECGDRHSSYPENCRNISTMWRFPARSASGLQVGQVSGVSARTSPTKYREPHTRTCGGGPSCARASPSASVTPPAG